MKKQILTVLILIILTAACTTQKPLDLDQASVRLKWLHQAQFAGNYVAKEKGFYARQGINLSLLEGGVENPAIADVLEGGSDFGIAGADDLVVAVSEGLPVKAIAVIYKYSPVTYFSLDENITSPHDFVGRKIGIKHGTGTTYSYVSMLSKLGIDRSKITEVPVGFDLSMLYNEDVDVWPGFRINEPLVAEKAGYKVYQVYPEDWGVTTYADVLFTTEEMIDENPEIVRGFVSATIHGWEYAIDNEEEAVDYVMRYVDTGREHQKAMLEKSIPLIHTGDSRIGYMEEEAWQTQISVLADNKVINNTVELSDLYTNEFITG